MFSTNLFEYNQNIFSVSFGFLCGILCLNLVTPVLPVSVSMFIIIAIIIWLLAFCVTFAGLHKLLQRNEPIPSNVTKKYLKYFGILHEASSQDLSSIKPNPKSIAKLIVDIDKYFISKWYCYISEDEYFIEESKTFIEEAFTRLTDVLVHMNHKIILQGSLNIFLRHLKEFRRSLKRKEKYGVGIEELYRYSHVCSSTTHKTTNDFYIHQLTATVLQHFINSELWNSLPCHIVVSILARRLVCYLLNWLSNPEVINYIIIKSVATREQKEKLQLQDYGRIVIEEFVNILQNDSTVPHTNKENVDSNDVEKLTEKQISEDETINEKALHLQHKVEEAATKYKERTGIEEYPEKDTVIFRNRKGRLRKEHSPDKTKKKTDPVKIHEPKNTVRTWRDSRDLACVSLGQDPLDMIGASTESTRANTGPKQSFWDVTVSKEECKHESPPSASQLFNEVMNITTMEGLKTSMKPLSDVTERTLHNIKDLQVEVTVHNALHKIGDFQVTTATSDNPLNYLHYLPPNTLLHSSVMSNSQRILHAKPEDEAAGMVEGILDFGRAGFRKGLRLTGLQDNIETAKTTLVSNNTAAKNMTKSVRDHVKKKLEELKKSEDSEDRLSSIESADSVWINPLQVESPNYDGHILLEKEPPKSHSDTGQTTKTDDEARDIPIPSISMEDTSGTDSPDPEYEDTADLASSIAKLRSLLQQRSSESSLSTPALSPMPEDYILKQAESDGASDLDALEVDGVMPSFYKFCTKTASGVFSNTINTIKTALPGNNTDNVYTVELWRFTADERESDCFIRMKKLLSERKEYCVLDKEIDAAYDALDSVDVFPQSPVITNLQFEDEFDDFEGKVSITKALTDIICELLADYGSPLIQEPIIRAILLMVGATIETEISSFIDNAMANLAEHLFTVPESTNSNILTMNIEEYLGIIETSSSDILRCVVGKNSFRKAIKLLVSSLQHPKINQDLLFQGIELVAMKLIEESIQGPAVASA